MEYFVASNINNNILNFININNNSVFDVELKLCKSGIRSIFQHQNSLFYCDTNCNTVNRLNLSDQTEHVVVNCIGKYPSVIKRWRDLMVIACSESDTVETCMLNGQQIHITNRLGSLLSDICVIGNTCYAICTLTSELYLLSLPELYYVDVINLRFNPNAFLYCGKELYITGSRNGKGVICKIDKWGSEMQLSEAPFMPIYACRYRNSIISSCQGEEMLCWHDAKDLKIKRCVKLNDTPGKIYSYNKILYLHFYYSKKMMVLKENNGKEIRSLPVNSEISDCVIINI